MDFNNKFYIEIIHS